jgi:hypothetical protein
MTVRLQVARNAIRAIAVAAVMGIVGTAAGQVLLAPPGTLSALTCETLPAPLTTDLRVDGQTLNGDRLRQVLSQSLATRRVSVAAGAALKMNLTIDLVRKADTRDPKSQFYVKLWSNKQNSLLGGRREGGGAPPVHILNVEMTLAERIDGPCVWRAKAALQLDGRNEQAAAEQMIPLLIDHLGRTVQAVPIDID